MNNVKQVTFLITEYNGTFNTHKLKPVMMVASLNL
jgi:hypothetical protein